MYVLTAQRGDPSLTPLFGSVCAVVRLVQELEAGFELVGSYMHDSEHWDMCYGRKGEEEHVAHIKHLPWFTRDPLYGDGGPAAKS